MQLCYRQHRRIQRACVAGNDGLQGQHDLRRCDDRIDTGFRTSTMRALAGDVDVEERTTSHHGTGTDRELAHRQRRAVVHSEDAIARELLEQAIVDHGLGATNPLLGRLEDEIDLTVEVARGGQILGGAQQDGGVAIVTACVHLAIVDRSVGERIRLDDGQRVHVCAQAHRTRGVANAKRPDHPGLADTGVNVEAELTQFAGNKICRAVFLESEFRMRVDVAAQGRQLAVHGGNVFDDVHVAAFPFADPPP